MSAIAAVLNCYTTDPAEPGANRAQVVVRTGGAIEIHGDDTLARHILRQLAAAQLPGSAPAREERIVIPRKRRRPREA